MEEKTQKCKPVVRPALSDPGVFFTGRPPLPPVREGKTADLLQEKAVSIYEKPTESQPLTLLHKNAEKFDKKFKIFLVFQRKV